MLIARQRLLQAIAPLKNSYRHLCWNTRKDSASQTNMVSHFLLLSFLGEEQFRVKRIPRQQSAISIRAQIRNVGPSLNQQPFAIHRTDPIWLLILSRISPL